MPTERYCDETLVKFRLDIPRAELWYPHGYGNQPLYTLVVSTGGREIYRERFGIRTVKIMQLHDKKGSAFDKKKDEVHNLKYDFNEEHSGFILKANGRRIFCQGANYVPCEPFVHGDTAKKQTELLLLARDMGVNMIRMWGGGDFETRHFYDECSRLGIMVTQDFLMACGSYPEGETLIAETVSGDLRDRTYYREGAPRLTPAACEMRHDAEAKTVTVSAKEYIHAVELDADAVFSDNCFSLLPGESVTVSYRPLGEIEKIDVTAYTF